MLTQSLKREVNLRDRLPGDVKRILRLAAWAMAVFGVWLTFHGYASVGLFGVDAHAYWSAAKGPMYTTGPATLNAYLYSPLFAQLLWPLAQLPAIVFAIVFSGSDALLLVWLLKPLGWRWALPLYLASLPEVWSGNIFIMLASAAVLGFRHPGTWALSALTKLTPTLGPLWWLVRREWRPLMISVVTVAVLALPSVLLTPDLWWQWIHLLTSNVSESTHPMGAPQLPPLVYRLPVGIALVLWGANRGRRWTIPVGMVLVTPFLWLGSYTLLAAIPRINDAVGMTRPLSQPTSLDD